MDPRFPNEKWLDVPMYPGFQISNYGRVRRFRKKSKSYEICMIYRDKHSPHPDWNYVTLWKNGMFYKKAVRVMLKEIWEPVIKKELDEKKKHQHSKYQDMIDNFDPCKTSPHAYMKYLRANGYKFSNCILSAALSEKKKKILSQLF